MRGVPSWSGDFRPAIAVSSAMLTAATSSRAASGTLRRDRLRPVPVQPCAAAAASVGLPHGRARAKLSPRNGESPGDAGPPPCGHPGRSALLGCSRLLADLALAVRPGAPEVAPWKPVQKVVTGEQGRERLTSREPS